MLAPTPMSSKFLRALSKMKLVELDDEEQKRVDQEGKDSPEMSLEEIDRILAAEAEKAGGAPQVPQQRAPAPQPVAPPAAPTTSKSEIVEDRPFAAIYAEAAVQEAPYSAEKLLRVLDGLKAMDPHTRKAAVIAMDAADEEWTIADAVLDAQRKIRVLESSVQGVAAHLQQIQETAAHEKTTRDAYLAEAAATIRAKIQELEETLQAETAQIAAQKADIDGKVAAAVAASARETARLQMEVQRLREIPATFAVERPGEP